MLMRLLIVLGILVYSNVIFAKDIDRTEINKILTNLHPINLKYQGKDGIWFSKDEAEGLLWLLEKKLPQALDLIDVQEKRSVALKLAIESYKISNNSYLDLATFNQQALKIALDNFPDLVSIEHSWYTNRTATYIYGVITGVAVIIGSAIVLEKINDDK